MRENSLRVVLEGHRETNKIFTRNVCKGGREGGREREEGGRMVSFSIT